MKKKYKLQESGFFEDDNLEILYQMFKLKNLFRQGWLKRDIPESKGESVADHTFGTAMTAWILTRRLNLELNEEKLIKMALVHEIGEIYAGDITPVDGISLAQKYELELQSIEKVFSSYPEGDEFINLWKEFEKAESPEAKFLKQIDKFEMGMQAEIYKGHGHNKMDEFLDSAERVLEDAELQELFQKVINRGAKE
jgi:putative hydrolase of HD superfamily